ncbi:hypothetical protein RRG08_014876 [Elysia crispata]|uniref:Uncharacterized protein n=1 Tax=Elysia crispata TaxID=231223 RepID=A0AAE1APH4_9GAST|nr:hypothetical protein RRG08_014876 [Elysia crispata]
MSQDPNTTSRTRLTIKLVSSLKPAESTGSPTDYTDSNPRSSKQITVDYRTRGRVQGKNMATSLSKHSKTCMYSPWSTLDVSLAWVCVCVSGRKGHKKGGEGERSGGFDTKIQGSARLMYVAERFLQAAAILRCRISTSEASLSLIIMSSVKRLFILKEPIKVRLFSESYSATNRCPVAALASKTNTLAGFPNSVDKLSYLGNSPGVT